MKFKVRSEKPEEKEPEVEFWLEKVGNSVWLECLAPNGNEYSIASIEPDGMALYSEIGTIGVQLDREGRVKILN